MSHFDDDATDRAAAAYARKGECDGLTPDQLDTPSLCDSGREGDIVTLRGGGRRQVLARYRVRPDGRLRRLKPTVRG